DRRLSHCNFQESNSENSFERTRILFPSRDARALDCHRARFPRNFSTVATTCHSRSSQNRHTSSHFVDRLVNRPLSDAPMRRPNPFFRTSQSLPTDDTKASPCHSQESHPHRTELVKSFSLDCPRYISKG